MSWATIIAFLQGIEADPSVQAAQAQVLAWLLTKIQGSTKMAGAHPTAASLIAEFKASLPKP